MSVTSPPVAERPTKREFDKEAFKARCRDLGATTVAEQAALVGLTRQHMYRIYAGTFRPNIDTLDRMEAALGVHRDEFCPAKAA